MPHAFEWKEEYSVQVKEIDDQHKKLVELIFRLFTAIKKQTMQSELGDILNELIEYASYHFATEEKYFKKFDYEFTDEHIKAHRTFGEKMLELQKKHKNDEIKISFELIDFLEDWLLDHLMTTDHKYIECFTSHGLK